MRGIEEVRGAKQVSKPQQYLRGDTVAGGDGIITGRFGAMNEFLMVVRGEEETAACLVLEVIQQGLGQFDEKLKIAISPTRLQKFESSIDQEGIIVEVGVEVGATVLVTGQQASVFPESGTDEIEGALGRDNEIRSLEQSSGAGHALDHEPVPGGQHLVVTPRSYTSISGGEQFAARLGQQGGGSFAIQIK